MMMIKMKMNKLELHTHKSKYETNGRRGAF